MEEITEDSGLDLHVSATGGASGNPVTFLATGNCSIDASNDVHLTGAGSCTVTASQDGNTNYNAATPVPQTFQIAKKAITVSADPQTKVYGANDPDLTYQVTSGSLVDGDSFNGSLTRQAGESVAGSPYAIQQGTLSAGSNYTLTFNEANLTITPKQLTGSFTAENKVYDGGTSATVATTSLPGVLSGDTVNLDVTNAHFDNKNVDTDKTVTADLALSGAQAGNYSLSSNTASTTANITPKQLTGSFTADNKTYDGGTSATVATTSLPGVLSGDTVNLDVTNAHFDNKNVDTDKTVTADLALSGAQAGNYSLSSATGTATANITQRPITVSADPQTKTYGDADPNLTYQITSGSLVTGDSFSGALSRVAGENVGPYAIQQNTLTAGSNYNLTYVGANLTIEKRAITVTADAKSKTYGDSDPALTYQLTNGNLVGSDTLSGDLTRVTGETVAGSPYAIQQGTLTAGSNYTLNYVGANFTINARPITITADAKSKLFGDPDPALTYRHTSGTLVGSDQITGSLTRVPGELVGQYDILQGSVSAGPNYAINYVGAKLTIGAWTTKGFYAPVDMSTTTTLVFNTVKGGSTVPLKFELFKGATELTDPANIKQPLQATKVSCTSGASEDAIEELAATGGTALRYDTTGGQFIYNWKTPTGAGTCYKVTVTAQDGSTISAYFKLK